MHSMKTRIAIAAALVVGGVGYTLWPAPTENATSSETAAPSATSAEAPAALAVVKLPDTLSPQAQIGKLGFDAKCATCHGANAAGQADIAPPLIHIIYEPSHHGDESFQRAAAQGVSGHHWPFGDMPPVEGVTTGDIKMITAYIRELQRANGIK